MNINCPCCVPTCDNAVTRSTCNFMDAVLTVHSSCSMTKPEKAGSVFVVGLLQHATRSTQGSILVC